MIQEETRVQGCKCSGRTVRPGHMVLRRILAKNGPARNNFWLEGLGSLDNLGLTGPVHLKIRAGTALPNLSGQRCKTLW